MRMRALALSLATCFFVLHGCFILKKKNNPDAPGKVDTKTGLKFADVPNLTVQKFKGQVTAPGMVFIEGGTFIMGGTEQDIAYAYDNRKRQVTIASFYMDETEVSNLNWKVFVAYMAQDSSPAKAKLEIPDTTVWRRELAYNDPYIQYYYQHPGFSNYPVVGVNWYQAHDYCKWRSATVQKDQSDRHPNDPPIPDFRLPTEAEWEYAARGGLEQELYPWEGKSLRDGKGRFQANFKRGRGDYAGQSNKGGSKYLNEGLNDKYMIPAPVKPIEYKPNGFGLYNMAGNVAEWTEDTYRVLSYEDVDDLNPSRRFGGTSDQSTIDTVYNHVDYPSKGAGPISSLLFHPDSHAGSVFDNVKVYRGGSWADPAYYLSTGTRRFSYADSTSSQIGFRCAQVRVGRPF